MLPPEQRRACPVASVLVRNGNDVSDIAAMNAAAEKAHESILAPCPHCGRTFNPERLPVHLRSYGGKHGTSKPVKTRHQIEARSLFRKIDRNSNGELDWSELHHVSPITVRDHRHSVTPPPTCFRLVMMGVLSILLFSCPMPLQRCSDFGLDDVEIQHLFSSLDVNSDGKITQEEFLYGFDCWKNVFGHEDTVMAE